MGCGDEEEALDRVFSVEEGDGASFEDISGAGVEVERVVFGVLVLRWWHVEVVAGRLCEKEVASNSAVCLSYVSSSKTLSCTVESSTGLKGWIGVAGSSAACC